MLTIRTTFVSAVFATLNSLSLQEYVARWISDYLTSETGVTVMYAYPHLRTPWLANEQLRISYST
jgi:hypothetical protein